jgi:hypothetical protein
MKQNTEEFLNERRRVLEESFFQERNRQLLDKLRNHMATKEKKEALAAASGITDEAVLDHLIEANIASTTISALGIVPLIAVAWADGALDERERKAVLTACEAEGVTSGSVSYELLQRWLSDPPNPALLSAWKDFVAAASKTLSPIALAALKEDVLGRARKIAHASGGILGIGSISAKEQESLRELEQAFPA